MTAIPQHYRAAHFLQYVCLSTDLESSLSLNSTEYSTAPGSRNYSSVPIPFVQLPGVQNLETTIVPVFNCCAEIPGCELGFADCVSPPWFTADCVGAMYLVAAPHLVNVPSIELTPLKESFHDPCMCCCADLLGSTGVY